MEAARLNRRAALLPLLLLALPTPPRAASGDEFAAALTEALVIGAKRAVTELGRPDGFLGDPEVRVPLPGMLAQARSALALVGLAGLADDLEVRLNRAAEQAVPVAGELLVGAIRSLSFEMPSASCAARRTRRRATSTGRPATSWPYACGRSSTTRWPRPAPSRRSTRWRGSTRGCRSCRTCAPT
jgi:hypothetical protein